MKFKVTEEVKDFREVDGEYKTVMARKRYEVHTWDDLQNWFLSLIDFSKGPVTIEVEKIEEEDDEQ